MARVATKGKIAKPEWPKIRQRYEAGEALASIARDYGCTAPAIRYILNRAAAADPSGGRAAGSSARTGTLRELLRGQVTSDVAQFLVAVDAAATTPSAEKFARLRVATDRIMRCAARVLIELERGPGARRRTKATGQEVQRPATSAARKRSKSKGGRPAEAALKG